MSSIEIRKELHDYIDNSSDEIIASVFAMLKTYNDIEKNKTEDLEEYNSEIENARKEIENGIYSTHEDAAKLLLGNDS